MTRYDYIICGSGCAGLSLAYYLSISGKNDKRILLIDRDVKTSNDRTWSFWEEGAGIFESIVHSSWTKINFHCSFFEEQISISPYNYKRIMSSDFYAFIRKQLDRDEHIDFLQAEILEMNENGEEIQLITDVGNYTASMAFKSHLDKDFDFGSSQNVLQHFKGWEIETVENTFEPDVATFMDFRIDQNGEIRFLYVLPESSKRALVEVAIFSNEILESAQYDVILKDYIEQYLDCRRYEILENEFGIIPMSTYPFERHNTARLKHIGTAGGWVKPSSGYAFTRIQEKSKALAEALLQNQNIDMVINGKNRFRRYDQIFLNALLTGKASGDEVFGKMFKHLDSSLIFKFLDEKTSFFEDLRVFTGPPTLPFVQAFFEEL